MPSVNRTGTPAVVPTNTETQRYTVQPGDSLSRIAARLGVTTEQLTNANLGRYPRLSDPRALQAGWNLTVPTGGQLNAAQPTTTQANTATSSWTPKSNDKVLFVAVNNSDAHQSTLESDALTKRGTDVTVIKDAKEPDTIQTRDARGNVTTHKLDTPEGARNFALTLGLPAEQTQKIADIIQHAGPDAKDEFAALAQEWAKAERGEQIPSRMVLSGHHVGGGVYGENNGKLDWDTMKNLANAMPRAARSVEDLLIAGCYSGGQNFMEKYQAMFPNVKTIMAYEGSSPGAASGAVAHQKSWERLTRGESQGLNKDAFAGMRKGENVSVWTRDGGLQGAPPADIATQRADMERNRGAYNDALSGKTPIADPQTGPVREFYTATQRLLQNPALPADEKAALTAQRDQCIRMLFYGPVSKRFGETYGTRLANGYQALGLPVPDFQRMSRAEALASIQRFEQALAANPNAPAAVTRLAPILQGLKDLSPAIIPDTWV